MSQKESNSTEAAPLMQALKIFRKKVQSLEFEQDQLKYEYESLCIELQNAHQQHQDKVDQLDAITLYLNRILFHMTQGIVFIDLKGKITTYNPAAQEVLGVEKEAVLFASFWDNFSDTLLGFSMKRALGESTAPSMLYTTLNRDKGEVRELQVETKFVLKEHPKEGADQEFLQGMIVLIRDITHLRTLQTLAARNDRMKDLGEMAAMVAHEIRNPLGGIRGFAALLVRDLADKPDLQAMAQQIVEGTQALDRLVKQILHYARPVDPHYIQTDLRSLLEEVKAHIVADRPLCRNIQIVLKLPVEPIAVPLDSQLMKAALLNLAVNGIQAMPEGGELTFELEVLGSDAIIRVSDTGRGIAPENVKKIYSPFFTTRSDGNGLGLSEVYKTIQAHAGDIEVHSTVETGTIFIVKIPLKAYKANFVTLD